MIDFKGICDALAARYQAAVLGTPTGAPAILATYGQMPKQAPALPAVVVVPQHGTVVANASQWDHHMHVRVYLLLARRPGDPATVERQRQLYLPYLLAATEGQMKLTYGSATGYAVKSALPTDWGWAEEDMAGTAYDAIWVEFDIWVQEIVSLVP